jgi:hypothetical protein
LLLTEVAVRQWPMSACSSGVYRLRYFVAIFLRVCNERSSPMLIANHPVNADARGSAVRRMRMWARAGYWER